jgi:hypothetical protein
MGGCRDSERHAGTKTMPDSSIYPPTMCRLRCSVRASIMRAICQASLATITTASKTNVVGSAPVASAGVMRSPYRLTIASRL